MLSSEVFLECSIGADADEDTIDCWEDDTVGFDVSAEAPVRVSEKT
jgi:hypothetical protein